MSIEQIALAVQAKNLAWSAQTVRSVDWIAAVGAVGLTDPLQSLTARFLGGDHHVYRDLLLVLHRKIARKQELTIPVKREIDDALFWWLHPACRACVAGHVQIADTPMLEDAPCMVCNGTGLAPHHHKTPVYGMTLQYLERAANECGRLVRGKVA